MHTMFNTQRPSVPAQTIISAQIDSRNLPTTDDISDLDSDVCVVSVGPSQTPPTRLNIYNYLDQQPA